MATDRNRLRAVASRWTCPISRKRSSRRRTPCTTPLITRGCSSGHQQPNKLSISLQEQYQDLNHVHPQWPNTLLGVLVDADRKHRSRGKIKQTRASPRKTLRTTSHCTPSGTASRVCGHHNRRPETVHRQRCTRHLSLDPGRHAPQ
jgi:hypothetical protein